MNNGNGNKPLCAFPTGTRVKIQELNMGRKGSARLYAMGLTPGTIVDIISCGGGPCRLKVRDADLVVGRGMAGKIWASPVSEGDM